MISKFKTSLQIDQAPFIFFDILIYHIQFIDSIVLSMSDPDVQKQLIQIRRAIYNKINEHTLDQQNLIQQQNSLLEQCRDRLDRRKAYDSLNSFSLNITNISSINNISATDDSFRNRFTEEFENSILNAAIKQIKNNCSEETFDTVMNYVINNKNKQYEELKKQLEKKLKEIEELSVLIIIKQKDINFLERDLADLKVKEDFLEQERKKNKKKATTLDQKQKRLHNAQMSLIFKEKLNLEGKRRYERQKEIHEEVLQRLESIYGKLNQLWSKIIAQMEKAQCSCQPNCWKQEVMKKCKQQLLDQRKILQEQQKQIQIEYQTMRNLSQQIKKVFINVQGQANSRKGEEIVK